MRKLKVNIRINLTIIKHQIWNLDKKKELKHQIVEVKNNTVESIRGKIIINEILIFHIFFFFNGFIKIKKKYIY